jgi:hypothetical protein
MQSFIGYTLLAANLLISQSDIDPDILQQWVLFIETEGLPSEQFVAFHESAVSRQLPTDFLDRLRLNPTQFISPRFNAATPAPHRILKKILIRVPAALH